HGAAADPTWVSAAGATTWLDLTDVDATDYSGRAGWAVVVNDTSDGLDISFGSPIWDPGDLSQGEVLYVSSFGDWTSLPVGTDGDVLTSGGAGANVTWETPSFFALDEVTPTDFSGAGDKLVAVNTGATALEFIDAPTAGGKAFTAAEYDTGDTFNGKPIYAILLDFGAGPDNTTKSVATGLGANDVFTVLDLQMVANDSDEAWMQRSDKGSFVYNKSDFKVYITTTNNLSAFDYTVLMKYIKEPVTLVGAFPHIIATVSGGPWGALADGVHVLHPTTYEHQYSPGTRSLATTSVCKWYYTQTASASYKLKLKASYTSSTRQSRGSFYTSNTATYSQTSFTTTSPGSPYSQAIGLGDRLFKAYTYGGKTLTIARASDFPINPATYTT
ncbi:MAG: hypothetical protein DRH97_06860, partial [Chloroflexi bacterium]